MTIIPLFVIFLMCIFAMFLVMSIVEDMKKDEPVDMSVFEQQSWEARQKRFQQMGI